MRWADLFFLFQAEDGIRVLVRARGLGDVYKRQLKWKRRLTDHGQQIDGPLDRHYFQSIYFRDPDGVIIEIATQGPGFAVDEPLATLGSAHRYPPAEMMVNNRDEARIAAANWPEPVPAITPDMALRHGMHHITAIGTDIERTHAFLGGLLGLQRVKMTSNFDDPTSAHWYWAVSYTHLTLPTSDLV